jgi:predicted GIY-YIG superfamily endonuclease
VSADPTPRAPSASTSTSGSAARRHPLGTVYLFHFDQRYEHAGHYTGWAEDLDHRVAEHLAGRGARLIEVITQAGIGFRLARTWPDVTRARERQLKRQGGASRHCPICQEDRKARGLPRRPTRDQPGRGDRRSVSTSSDQTSGPPQCPPVARARSGSGRSWPSTPGSLGPRGRRRPSSGVGPVAAKRLSCSVPGSPAPPGMRTPSPPSTGSPPSPAGLSRPASKPASNAPPGGLNRPAPTSWPPAPTSGCWPAKPANRPGGDPIASDPTVTTGSVIVNADLLRELRDGRWVQPTSAAGVLGIGAAAFLLSYDALHSLALASGVRPGLARIWPGVLDGFIVVATLTVVAAKRASRSTWYPWALVVLFSAASVAFNILHALDQALAPAGWVAALVFAMPPVALVLATHLLLQQGVWRRQHTGTAAAMGERPGEDATPRSAVVSTSPAREGLRQPEFAPTALVAASPLPASLERQPADAATRDRARQLYVQAQAAGRKLTGADLGRALGTSDSYGRLLLREFRTSSTVPENGTAKEA